MRHLKLNILLIAVCFISCKQRGGDINRFLSNKLARDSGILNFKDYNQQNWDKMYVIFPYAQLNSGDSLSSQDIDIIRKTGIETRDDIVVLALFEKGVLIDYTNLPRNKPDFSAFESLSNRGVLSFSKNDASFKYHKKGSFYYVNNPAKAINN